MNRTFLQEAIADAKTVKESAIANAKLALEESFTPHLKTMFSTKLHEMEQAETEIQEVELDEEEISLSEVENEVKDEASIAEAETEEETETEETEDEGEEEIDLENMTEEDLVGFIEQTVLDMEASGEITLDGDEAEVEDIEDEELDLDVVDDEVELEEVETEQKTSSTDEVKEMKKELFEAYNTVKVLKTSLNELNLLNAKLLYTNKIFKAKNLSESEKIKVVGAFDKAKTISETKLVFETLKEGFVSKSNLINKHLGSASKSVTTIKESIAKPVLETDEFTLRLQRLAGIIPNN